MRRATLFLTLFSAGAAALECTIPTVGNCTYTARFAGAWPSQSRLEVALRADGAEQPVSEWSLMPVPGGASGNPAELNGPAVGGVDCRSYLNPTRGGADMSVTFDDVTEPLTLTRSAGQTTSFFMTAAPDAMPGEYSRVYEATLNCP